MITRIFQKTVLDIKYSSSIFVKYLHHCNNVSYRNVQENIFSKNTALVSFSNERDVPKRENIPLHQQMHTNIFKKPLLCKTAILASTTPVNQCFTVNNIRQYSSSAPVIVTYNNGIWKMIAESSPVEYLTEFLKIIHCQIGLPWWATIIVTTVVMRVLVTLPLAIHDYQCRARIENMQPELKKIAKKLKMETQMGVATSGWTTMYAKVAFTRALSEERKQLYERDNCHPLKSVVMVFLQLPLWLSFSFSLRNMCYMLPVNDNDALETYLEFTTGGFGWVKDLTVADPYFALPILFGLSGLALIEVNQLNTVKNETKFLKYYRNFVRLLTLFFVYFMSFVPSSLTLFWVTHNCYALVQSLLLLSPKIRRLGRIPKTESEFPHPYSELYKRLEEKVPKISNK